MPAFKNSNCPAVGVFFRQPAIVAIAITAGLCLCVLRSEAWSAENDAVADKQLVAKHVPFKVDAKDTPSEPVDVVQPWKTIVLDKDYRGAWIVAGDLNGDGQAEIVSCRALMEGGDHYTASAVAHRLDGSVLWKWGNPKNRRDGLGCDYACQIYDWDGDGTNEVILAAKENGKTWLIELEGATGKEKRRFEIPNNSADCITFCNLSGNDRPTDVLLKTRYTQIWAYNYDGQQLWTSDMPGGQRTAHQARPIDIDGDGKDEVQAGFAMLNSDGSVRWALNDGDPIFDVGLGLVRGHLDCARVLRMADTEADSRLVLTFCGGERMAIVNGEGKILWHNPAHHFESVDIGKVTAGVPGKQIVVDIPYAPVGKKPI